MSESLQTVAAKLSAMPDGERAEVVGSALRLTSRRLRTCHQPTSPVDGNQHCAPPSTSSAKLLSPSWLISTLIWPLMLLRGLLRSRAGMRRECHKHAPLPLLPRPRDRSSEPLSYEIRL